MKSQSRWQAAPRRRLKWPLAEALWTTHPTSPLKFTKFIHHGWEYWTSLLMPSFPFKIWMVLGGFPRKSVVLFKHWHDDGELLLQAVPVKYLLILFSIKGMKETHKSQNILLNSLPSLGFRIMWLACKRQLQKYDQMKQNKMKLISKPGKLTC